MVNALWITLIGMGLVFVAILMLWGGMALLVRLTAERENSEQSAVDDASAEMDAESAAVAAAFAEAEPNAADVDLVAQKRRAQAAAAAVCAALALRKPVRGTNGAYPGALSAWQAVNRASQVNPASTLSRRKVAR